MRLSLLVLVLCTLTAWQHCAAEAAKARHFKWEVSNMFWSPDCEEKVVIGINGQFPGPTIRARAGDTIHVQLKNALHTEGVVIHWHGIRQIGTPWADGTAAISQCAINPEETFTYRFVVDKPGTYFYHGHYGMQRAAGLYGSLIVDVAEGEEEPFKYDGELNLLLSDWYHESIHTQMVALSSKPFRWIGEPQTELVAQMLAKLQPPQVVLRRKVHFVRSGDQRNFNHQWRIFEFEGQSVFNLRKNLAKELGYILGITLCVRAGSSGRLTPLVIDLPSDENTMSIFVLTANSPAAQALLYNWRSHLQLPQVVLWLMINYVRADDQGNFNHQWRILEFEGQSVLNLRKNLAKELGYSDNILGITPCVRAGLSGRRTPLVIDLPFDENTMSIFVLTANSPAAQALAYNLRSHLQLLQVVLWLMIPYVRADDQGNFNHQWKILVFEGQSVFNLMRDLASKLGYSDNILGITPFVQAGLSGRRTPLVIDLPCNDNTMDNLVLITDSPDFTRSVWAASTPVMYLSEPRDMVVHSMHGLPSKVAQGDIAGMQSFLTGIGDQYFIDCFNECLQPIVDQVQHEKCYREFIGSPLEQTYTL